MDTLQKVPTPSALKSQVRDVPINFGGRQLSYIS